MCTVTESPNAARCGPSPVLFWMCSRSRAALVLAAGGRCLPAAADIHRAVHSTVGARERGRCVAGKGVEKAVHITWVKTGGRLPPDRAEQRDERSFTRRPSGHRSEAAERTPDPAHSHGLATTTMTQRHGEVPVRLSRRRRSSPPRGPGPGGLRRSAVSPQVSFEQRLAHRRTQQPVKVRFAHPVQLGP
jgi:hypothetical protein